MKAKILIFILLIITPFMIVIAQNNSEVLNNKAVTDMHKAGLSRETVISKIETSTCEFDVTTAGLIALKKQGMPDDIINAMVNKRNSINHSAAPIPSISGKALKNTPKSKVNIELLNYVYTYYNDTVTPLEKTLANLKTKSKAFGYGGVNSVLEIDGASSSVKLTPANALSFVIKTGGAAPDIVLYQLKSTGKKRQAITGKFRMTGMQGSEGAITVNISMLDDGIFKISPSKSLEKGEYFFLNRSSSNAGTNSEVFAFSID